MKPEEVKDYLETKAKEAQAARDELDKKVQKMDGHIEKLNDEIERQGKENGETKDAFKKAEEKVIAVEDELKSITQSFDELRGAGGHAQEQKGYAHAAAEFVRKNRYSGGNITLVDGFEGSAFSTKATVTNASTSAGPLLEPQIMAGIVRDPGRPLSIRDLLTVLPTTADSIKYYKEKLFTNAAASQAGQGAAKAESSITFESATRPVETIAHWIPISDQIANDVPSLQAYIETRMREGLAEVEEDQILDGDGTSNTLLGLRPQATSYDTGLNVVGDTKIDQLRRAALQVRKARYTASGFVLSPDDWTAIELTKTDDKAYVFTNPVTGAAPRLWGRAVAESDAFSAGEFMSGAFAQAATLWDRQLVSVKLFDQHADFAARNMLMLRVEERVALTVERPKAFVTGSFA